MEWLLFGKLVLILLLVVGNAFFVGSEIALTSARRSRIKQLANTGNRSAKKQYSTPIFAIFWGSASNYTYSEMCK